MSDTLVQLTLLAVAWVGVAALVGLAALLTILSIGGLSMSAQMLRGDTMCDHWTCECGGR